MAVMAQHNIEVDKLLPIKPAGTKNFYPTMPTPEDEFENETNDEAQQRHPKSTKRTRTFEHLHMDT